MVFLIQFCHRVMHLLELADLLNIKYVVYVVEKIINFWHRRELFKGDCSNLLGKWIAEGLEIQRWTGSILMWRSKLPPINTAVRNEYLIPRRVWEGKVTKEMSCVPPSQKAG